MSRLPFFKMSGSGNDFIIIDNRQPIVPTDNLPLFASRVCRRGLSVGADGLILIESSSRVDFRWRFFNSDGSQAEMCGNGARCAARVAKLLGIGGGRIVFETFAGLIEAQIVGESIKIKMTDASVPVLDTALALAEGGIICAEINTGVPHAVIETAAIDAVPLTAQGREIRFHRHFAPAGTNVNYVAPLGDGMWAIRTYERGVEAETLACGTGSVAAALVLAARYGLPAPVSLKNRGGMVQKVHFSQAGGRFRDIFLEGDARLIYEGYMSSSAWDY